MRLVKEMIMQLVVFFKEHYKMIATGKNLMLIQKQISKLFLVEILLEMQQRFSLLQKQKKPFKIFQMLSNLQLNKVIL